MPFYLGALRTGGSSGPFWGGGAKSFGGSNLTYPHFQLSPRISATLFSKHRILTIFYFMFNFYINFCQIPQALRAELADLAEGPSLAIKRPSPTSRRLLTRALEGGGAKNALPSGFSRIAEKRRRAAPPFFQYLLRIE